MNLLMPNNYIISDFLQVLLVVLILVVIVDRYFLSLDQLLFLDLSRVLIDNFFELFPWFIILCIAIILVFQFVNMKEALRDVLLF